MQKLYTIDRQRQSVEIVRCLFLLLEKNTKKFFGRLSFAPNELLYILEWNKRLQHY